MSEKKENIFQILLNGIKIYSKNFIPFTKAMMFPVLGQIIGIGLILTASYYFTININKLIPIFLNNILLLFIGLMLCALPGFVIFAKAFWDYMVVMVSLNNMAENLMNKGNLKNIAVHNQVVLLKNKEYIMLLLIMTLIWIAALFLPFTVFLFKDLSGTNQIIMYFTFALFEIISLFIAGIISVYLSLSFQVFAFENISYIKVLKRSWKLIENSFWRTFCLCGILFLITSIIIPEIFKFILIKTDVISILSIPFKAYLKILFVNPDVTVLLDNTLAFFKKSCDLIEYSSNTLVIATVNLAVTSMLLPLGSICYTLLYKDIIKESEAKTKIQKKRKTKKTNV